MNKLRLQIYSTIYICSKRVKIWQIFEQFEPFSTLQFESRWLQAPIAFEQFAKGHQMHFCPKLSFQGRQTQFNFHLVSLTRIKFVDCLVLPVNLFLAHPPFNNTARNSGAPFTSQYKCSVWAYLSVWDCCLFFSLNLQLGISYSQAGRKGCPHPLAVSSYVDIFWVTLPFHKGKKFTKMFTNAYG